MQQTSHVLPSQELFTYEPLVRQPTLSSHIFYDALVRYQADLLSFFWQSQQEEVVHESFGNLLSLLTARVYRMDKEQWNTFVREPLIAIWKDADEDLVEKTLLRSLREHLKRKDLLYSDGKWELNFFLIAEAPYYTLALVVGDFIQTVNKEKKSAELFSLYIRLGSQFLIQRHHCFTSRDLCVRNELLEEAIARDSSLFREQWDALSAAAWKFSSKEVKELFPQLQETLYFSGLDQCALSLPKVYIIWLVKKMQLESQGKGKPLHHLLVHLTELINDKCTAEGETIWERLHCSDPSYFTFLQSESRNRMSHSALQEQIPRLLKTVSELYSSFLGRRNQERAYERIQYCLQSYLCWISDLLVIQRCQNSYLNIDFLSLQSWISILYGEVQKCPNLAVFFAIPGFFTPICGYGRTGPRYCRSRTLCFQLPQISIGLACEYSLRSNLGATNPSDMKEKALIGLLKEARSSELQKRSKYYMEAMELVFMREDSRSFLSADPIENLQMARREPREEVLLCLQEWMNKAPSSLLEALTTTLFREKELIWICQRCMEIDQSRTLLQKGISQEFLRRFFYSGFYGLTTLYSLNLYEGKISYTDKKSYKDLQERLAIAGGSLVQNLMGRFYDESSRKENLIFLEELIQLHANEEHRNWLRSTLSQVLESFDGSSLLPQRMELFLDVTFFSFLWRAIGKNSDFYQFVQSLCLSRYSIHLTRELLSKASHVEVPVNRTRVTGRKNFIHSYLLALNYHQCQPQGGHSWLQFISHHYFKSQQQHRIFFFLFSKLFLIPKPLASEIERKLGHYWRTKIPSREKVDALILRLKIIITAVTVDLEKTIEIEINCEDQISDCADVLLEKLSHLDCDSVQSMLRWQWSMVESFLPERSLLEAMDKDPGFYTDFLLYCSSRASTSAKEALRAMFVAYLRGDQSSWQNWRFSQSPYSKSAHTKFIRRHHPDCWEYWCGDQSFSVGSDLDRVVLKTSDPEYTLRMGSFVTGSCLDFCSSSTDENEVLASIMVDPKLNLFVLLNKKGDPVARVLVSLLLTQEPQRAPVLFLHKVFPLLSMQVKWQEEAYLDLIEGVLQCCKEMQIKTLFSAEPIVLASKVLGSKSDSSSEAKGSYEEKEADSSKSASSKSAAQRSEKAPALGLSQRRNLPRLVIKSRRSAVCLQSSVPLDLLPGDDFALAKMGQAFTLEDGFCYRLADDTQEHQSRHSIL